MKKKFFISKNIMILCSAIIASLILFIVSYKTVGFIYGINDDTGMRSIVSGEMSGTPDYHMIFSNVILGKYLSLQYTLFPDIDWYGLCMLTLLCISCAGMFYEVITMVDSIEKIGKCRKVLYSIGGIFVIWLCMARFVYQFEFTTVAVILGAYGVYLFATHGDAKSKKGKMMRIILSCFFIFCAACVRQYMLIMIFPIYFVLLLHCLFGNNVIEQKRMVLLHVVLTVAILLSVNAINSLAYRSNEWKEYEEYNVIRSQIYDYYGVADYDTYTAFYESLGVPYEEYVLFLQYSLGLCEHKDAESLQEIGEYAKSLHEEELAEIISQRMFLIKDSFVNSYYMPLAIVEGLLLIACVFFSVNKEKRKVVFGTALLLVIMLMWGYLAYKGRMPSRIVFGMHMYGVMAACIYLREIVAEKDWQICFLVNTLILANIVVAPSLVPEMHEQLIMRETLNDNYSEFKEYMMANSDSTYLIVTDSIAMYTDNFTVHKPGKETNWLTFGGWSMQSPLNIRQYENRGINYDNVLMDSINMNNVYYVAKNETGIKNIESYAQYFTPSEMVKIEEVEAGEETFLVYKLEAKIE